MVELLLQEGAIGRLRIPNRFVRPATSETMGTARGEVTEEHIALHTALARGGVGLNITGHTYVHPRGQYYHRQTGIYSDDLIPGLRRLTQSVHGAGGRIFVQLAHAGSQSRIPTHTPLAPSPVPNPLTGHVPAEATEADIADVIAAFGAAARRAMEAGFDGIHIHAANGYLLSEFNSPLTNLRTDGWGGDAGRRGRLLAEVYGAIRQAVGPDVPVTAKLGVADAVPGGVTVAESVARAVRLAELGLDGIEVSCGLMSDRTDSCREYVGVDRRRALADRLYHRLWGEPAGEAYFLEYARAIKGRLSIPVMLVGGMRTVERMAQVLSDGDADFICMARPLIREPNLPQQIAGGRRGMVDCTSCNLCLMHEGKDSLRCWRKSWGTLLDHAWRHYVRDGLLNR